MAWASLGWNNSAWGSNSQRTVLASVIQGEAGGPAGQSAVAQVMQNRLNDGGFGNSLQSVVTPSNFNGWNNTPSPGAYGLADQLIAGQPIQSGAGNALYFASPAVNNASWATNAINSGNGTDIGGNYFFSNNKGGAISGASSGPLSLSMMTPQQSAAGMPGGTTGAQPGGGTGSQPGGSTGSQPGGSSGSATDTSTGTPVNITDPNAIANKGLTTLGAAVDKSTSGMTADTSALTTAGTSWFNFLGTLLSGGTGIFARVGVGMLALVLLIVGLWMAGRARD
jgi:Cell Wall Hydrolase